MTCTLLATYPASVAGGARPCGFGAGATWQVKQAADLSAIAKQVRHMTANTRRPRGGPV